mmetsp:Transcript_62515/g.104039  ORF Transcript_62515/g.104039 Transcript_62515/m.104039 type:complete len:195 (-) Transcript_62515:338-922(-)|eukprot:CAMPEP_0119322928 /NCGR_PEP_ID=MMETSP1333-20130426/59525_1 /TAXON_ID=418940 /ORGANISM="Scyphosphaera apsteinii, Strain RCC1455" /LENGTH=194 /DNA_ID=CAMNT_0007330265 /DNA_START=88 /DNA_END=672 /DNA_ORIENTATION=-
MLGLATTPVHLGARAPLDGLMEFANRCANLPLAQYPRQGLDPGPLPVGWIVNRYESIIGCSPREYERAAAALVNFQCMQLDWLQAVRAGDVLAICARQFGCIWIMNANRLLPEPCPTSCCCSVRWGTTVRHVLAGEERVQVRWNQRRREVTFSVLSFSRPRSLQALAAYPLVLAQQRRFARDAAAAMRRAAAGQ